MGKRDASLDVDVQAGTTKEQAERLLAAGINDALHHGLPAEVWSEVKRARAYRLGLVGRRRSDHA